MPCHWKQLLTWHATWSYFTPLDPTRKHSKCFNIPNQPKSFDKPLYTNVFITTTQTQNVFHNAYGNIHNTDVEASIKSTLTMFSGCFNERAPRWYWEHPNNLKFFNLLKFSKVLLTYWNFSNSEVVLTKIFKLKLKCFTFYLPNEILKLLKSSSSQLTRTLRCFIYLLKF